MRNKNISIFSLFVWLVFLIVFSNPIANISNATSVYVGDNSFLDKLEITIDNTLVQDDLTNFPLLFKIINSDLSTSQTDGDDIIFYDETGTSQLDHEIELFNHSSGELVAWVRIPYLSSSEDTIIQMLFGNPSVTNSESPSAVWAEYDGVYHLSQLKDATGVHDLTQAGSVLPDTYGKFATAQKFDGYGNDYLTTNTNFGISTSFSIECWVKIDNADTDQTFVTHPHSSTGTAQRLMLDWGNDVALARNYQSMDQGTSTKGTSPINDGSWHYLVHTFDNEYNKLYVDGKLEGSDPYSGIVRCIANQFYIGREGSNGDTKWQKTVMTGLIDEVSVTKNVFSAARIKTEFNNQHDPSAFYSIGSHKHTITPGFLPIITLTGLLCTLVLMKRRIRYD
ncbi:MAG: DUF2341 domain-containing protein [Candidatus Hodarchaeales archaeon]|jgi:hypothetical protein